MFGGPLPDQHYHAWVTLVRITELVYNTGRDEWNDEDIRLLSRLVLRHNRGRRDKELCCNFTQFAAPP